MLRLPTFLQRSLRYKLLALVTFPMLLVVPAILLLTADWNNRYSYQQLFMKVNTDLSVARDAFTRIRLDYLNELERLGESFAFRSQMQAGDEKGIAYLLGRLRGEQAYAFVHLWDADGRPLLQGQPEAVLPTPLWQAALAGRGAAGVEVREPEELRLIDRRLVERVHLPLVPTPRAVVTRRHVENRAMWLRTLYPVRDGSGGLVAMLDAAVLLNGNFPFVDTIRDLVYGKGSLPEGALGTVTLFVDDVRISTNVPIRPGERALGTRVSAEVREHVLDRGNVWIDRAFVVNDWYISAYEPVTDVHGERVGMLYAGFLEAPFRAARTEALEELVVVFLLVIAASVVLAIVGARSIFDPVERMTAVVRATQRGEERRIGGVRSEDEIGELARQFDAMLDLLGERNRQVQRAADDLEIKVADRTRELCAKNAHLERTIELLDRTREQLVTKEKLAAIGELTAGIAHEINNPTAVILGNLDIVTAELGHAAEPVAAEIQLMVQQVYRIRAIINNLLQYSRPTAYAVSVEAIDVGATIDDTLVLVRHALDKKRIRARKVFRAESRITINRQHLQHVLVNLIVNAVNAMEPGGQLTLGTADWNDTGVLLYVKDTGSGIAPEHLDQIFDPFFTTRSQGTGLGLAISYGILRRYGGSITVRSRLGRGSVFFVWLQREPQGDGDEDESEELLARVV